MEDAVKLPTLEEFLSQSYPWSCYVEYPGFQDLYVRKTDVYLQLFPDPKICTRVVTVANVSATNPGQGSWQKLVDDLCDKGWAVYVENVHNERFAAHLEKQGYVRVNQNHGAPHLLYNHQGHLEDVEK